MIGAGKLQSVAVADIQLDKENPRIRKFLEMYGDDPTPDQFYLALGAGGDDEGGASSTTFEKLKNSILTNGGIIQPVMLNRSKGGALICIDGNTRVALYKNFSSENIPGNWSQIPALVTATFRTFLWRTEVVSRSNTSGSCRLHSSGERR